ncbi:protein phosphatase 1 regulatory subunit 36-like [Ruditapes philippinarum]|uniref:protein phosphatase 1 regulatory subunit 36-like n=1 Tax=Ruditapes philippinarum TaxID=129788 RepID=UPI00295AC843|nr:protein phosphatase 1 regulatory subunit 36-like [Ruditapes philippinarum]
MKESLYIFECVVKNYYWRKTNKYFKSWDGLTDGEPSLSEKQAYADSLVKLQAAEKYLGRAYCVLVLGLGLEEQHHMSCGISRVSSTDKDRAMFETLYSFCTFVVWITFRRKDFEAVKKEVGRMLRSDTFNPAIRVKNAPEEKETEKKEEKSGEGKKEIKIEKKITPAEYRRLQPVIDKRNFKIGILGDSLSQYNPVTLSPMGAENEDEDNEGEDGEQKQADDNTADKPQTDRGMSRTQTAVSEAVTDAFTED